MTKWTKALLILNLEIFLLVPMCTQTKMDRGYKSADQYWAETGLDAKDFEALLTQDNCQSTQQMFLACVNAIGQAAERYQMAITPDGTFQKLGPQDISERLTEKKALAKWSQVFSNKKQVAQISFLGLWQQLKSQQVKAREKSAVIASGINGFLSIYKDPHTYILPLAMYEEVIANSENRSANAGFIARRLTDRLIVRKVLDGSPAAMAGLKKGDQIFAVNGHSVAMLLPSQVADAFRMRETNRMALTVDREGKKQYLEIMKFEKVYPSVTSKLLESGVQASSRVGLITLNKFGKNACEQTRQHLVGLIEQNISGVVLDLRDNPGGQVEEAACIINLFVNRGTYEFQTKYLDPKRAPDFYTAESDPIYNGPLAILINSGSASASEIVAGSLRDLGRARLVGERSFGKGSFQDGKIWAINSKIALFETEGLYYFPSGWTPQLVGLEPDVKVDFNDADGQREDALFHNPIMPLDNWSGPQNLAWLLEKDCTTEPVSLSASFDDPQMQKAEALLSCGAHYDRHGSL
jgi:carboxyl-terminal processing protease